MFRPPVLPSATTKVVEWNDVRAGGGARAPGRRGRPHRARVDERTDRPSRPRPSTTRCGRSRARRACTLLAIDETHTICCGPGGYTGEHGLEPDVVTVGKLIAGGIPASAYGFTDELADRIVASIELEDADVGGAAAPSPRTRLPAAMRATLAEVLTDEAFARMIPLAGRWTSGVEGVIADTGRPWHVTQLGCRAEYPRPDQPRNGTQAHAAGDFTLERLMHLYALNRGILLTPFHNMALMAPSTTGADVDRHTDVFPRGAGELTR